MAVTSIANKLKSGSLLVGNTAYDPGAFVSIATYTVGAGGSSSITFSSIPQTYKHLQIRSISRTTYAGTGLDDTLVQFNGDTTSVYAFHRLMGNGTAASATGFTGYTAIYVSGTSVRANSTANAFGGMVLDILDYTNTSKNKVTRALEGVDINGTGGEIHLMSGLWPNTSAITSITLMPESSHTWAQYSQFALYGVKG